MEIQRADNPGEDTLHARDEANADRRKFLAALGRFSVVTPPTITLLLSTALTSEAIAQSGGREYHHHHHHHHHHDRWFDGW